LPGRVSHPAHRRSVAAKPDYVGMGTGNGPIEYLIAKSEASASADLITAARTRWFRQLS
jgi:hypothetical protein